MYSQSWTSPFCAGTSAMAWKSSFRQNYRTTFSPTVLTSAAGISHVVADVAAPGGEKWEHLKKSGGKQWQATPKNLPRMQRTRAIPVAWNLERKLGGFHRIGMQAAEKKRALPLLGTKSLFPDCPVRSIVSTLCYPGDVAKEGFLKQKKS